MSKTSSIEGTMCDEPVSAAEPPLASQPIVWHRPFRRYANLTDFRFWFNLHYGLETKGPACVGNTSAPVVVWLFTAMTALNHAAGWLLKLLFSLTTVSQLVRGGIFVFPKISFRSRKSHARTSPTFFLGECKMANVTHTPTPIARSSLYRLSSDILSPIQDTHTGKSTGVLANVYGIDGMGRTTFISGAAVPWCQEHGVKFFPDTASKPLSEEQSEPSTVITIVIHLLRWLFVDILHDQNSMTDIQTLEARASQIDDDVTKLVSTLVKKIQVALSKGDHSIAIFLDDSDRFEWRELTWLQEVVLDSLSTISRVAVVLTSHDQLTWYRWEVSKRCEARPLSVFTQEELDALCPNSDLAKKIEQLAYGHPATIDAMINRVRKQWPETLTDKYGTDLPAELDITLLEELARCIEVSLQRLPREWMRELMRLAAVADHFDPDILQDIVDGTGLSIPSEEFFGYTDIAWDMRDSGLAEWSRTYSAYVIKPNLQLRIVVYMQIAQHEKYIQVLPVLAKAYLERANEARNWVAPFVEYLYYSVSKEKTANNREMLRVIWHAVEDWVSDSRRLPEERDLRALRAALEQHRSFRNQHTDVYDYLISQLPQG